MRSLLATVTAAVALTASCGGGAAERVATPPEQAVPSTGPAASPAGPIGPAPAATVPTAPSAPRPAAAEALQFTASALDGSKIVGTDFAGKDLALWFWAPW
ncbi:MAG: hypothetical protein CYG61_09430 [Actinobacteria bacterium]|nr:MAG: hypothetical protein CYG61_09430 [Actinomycetota bacterium]